MLPELQRRLICLHLCASRRAAAVTGTHRRVHDDDACAGAPSQRGHVGGEAEAGAPLTRVSVQTRPANAAK